MRQRKLKDFEGRKARVADYIIEEQTSCRGHWREAFVTVSASPEEAADLRPQEKTAETADEKDIYMELGCGKGRFLLGLAARQQEALFLGAEGNESVLIQAAEKAKEAELANVRYLPGYINEPKDLFAEDELAGIYLNFSDPWPKARHEKRRLTARHYLDSYEYVIKDGGFIAVKTDNEPLFRFTMEQIEEKGMEVVAYTEDLHQSPFVQDNIMTEYEEKFVKRGLPIYHVKVEVKKSR